MLASRWQVCFYDFLKFTDIAEVLAKYITPSMLSGAAVAPCGNSSVHLSLLWVSLTAFGKLAAANVFFLQQPYERREFSSQGFRKTFSEAAGDLLTLWGRLPEEGARKGKEISLPSACPAERNSSALPEMSVGMQS